VLQPQGTELLASFRVCHLTARQCQWLLRRDYCTLDIRRSRLHHLLRCSCLRLDKNQTNVQADGKGLMTVHPAEVRPTVQWAMYFFVVQQTCLAA
jgi:hypothetical protein